VVSRVLLRSAILAESSLEGKEQEMIRKHFRIRRYVFGLAFAAALIAPAAAQAVSGVMTDGPATGVRQTDARHAALLSNKTVAPASPLSAQPTGIGQQAYAARMQAMADAYKRMQSQPTSIGQQAYGARLQATADRYASIGQGPVRSENSFGAPGPSAGGAQGPVAVKTASVSSSSGFDWNDAGIGAGAAFGIALLLVTAVALGRRYRSHPDGTGLASA
jgi:hypothetical protein